LLPSIDAGVKKVSVSSSLIIVLLHGWDNTGGVRLKVHFFPCALNFFILSNLFTRRGNNDQHQIDVEKNLKYV